MYSCDPISNPFSLSLITPTSLSSPPTSPSPFRFIHSKLPHETAEREAPPKSSNNLLYGSKQLKEAYQSIFTLYSGFVGSLHFQAFSRLLGYQGIAMLLDQLLNVVDSGVSI